MLFRKRKTEAKECWLLSLLPERKKSSIPVCNMIGFDVDRYHFISAKTYCKSCKWIIETGRDNNFIVFSSEKNPTEDAQILGPCVAVPCLPLLSAALGHACFHGAPLSTDYWLLLWLFFFFCVCVPSQFFILVIATNHTLLEPNKPNTLVHQPVLPHKSYFFINYNTYYLCVP